MSRFHLEWFDGDAGHGYVLVRTESGARVSWRSLRPDDPLRSFIVVGEHHHPDALRSDRFAAGEPVTLVPEPDNPHDPNAVAVYDQHGEAKVGYVPAEHAAEALRMVQGGGRAIVMWESIEAGRRTDVRLLVAPSDDDMPRIGRSRRVRAGQTDAEAGAEMMGILGWILGIFGLLALGTCGVASACYDAMVQ